MDSRDLKWTFLVVMQAKANYNLRFLVFTLREDLLLCF